MPAIDDIQFTRNRHYARLMRNYIKLLNEENFIKNDDNESCSRSCQNHLAPVSFSSDRAFYRFINVAGNSVRKGKITGLDGIYLGPDGYLSKNPLACIYQKQLSDF